MLQFMCSFVVFVVLLLICTCFCNDLIIEKETTLNAAQSLKDGAVISANGGNQNVLQIGNEYHINVQSQQSYDLKISLNELWSFYPSDRSAISLTINGKTPNQAQDTDFLIVFSVGDVQYFSFFLHLDVNNIKSRIYPSLSSSKQENSVDEWMTDTDITTRWDRISNNNQWKVINEWQHQSLWPLQFVISNDPMLQRSKFQFYHNTTQSLAVEYIFDDLFAENKKMDIYILGDSFNEKFVVSSVNAQLITYPKTINPSNSPTSFPSLGPSLNPSHSPTLIPSLSPTQQPTNDPSPEPTPKPTKYPTFNPSMSPSLMPTPRPILIVYHNDNKVSTAKPSKTLHAGLYPSDRSLSTTETMQMDETLSSDRHQDEFYIAVKYDFIFTIVLFGVSCTSFLCICCAVNEWKHRRRRKKQILRAKGEKNVDCMKASDGELQMEEGNEFTVKVHPIVIGQKVNTNNENKQDDQRIKKISALDLSKVISQSYCESVNYYDDDDEKKCECNSAVSMCRTTVVDDVKIIRNHSLNM